MEEFRSAAKDLDVSDEIIEEMFLGIEVKSEEMLTELVNILNEYRPNVVQSVTFKYLPSA